MWMGGCNLSVPSFRARSKPPPCPAPPIRLTHLHAAGPDADRSHRRTWSWWLQSSTKSQSDASNWIQAVQESNAQRPLCTRAWAQSPGGGQPIRTVFGVTILQALPQRWACKCSFSFLFFPASGRPVTAGRARCSNRRSLGRTCLHGVLTRGLICKAPPRRPTTHSGPSSPQSLCVEEVAVVEEGREGRGSNRLHGSAPHNKL